MALVVKDRVKETTATTGTGTLTLAGAVAGFQTFASALSNADTTYYAIREDSTGEWEVGLGTFTASGTLLSRDTILESSNAGSAINLTVGSAEVFITYPAEKSVYLDASGDVTSAAGQIDISNFNNDAGYSTTTGTVTSVAASAGTGISISGSPITTSGTLTITNTAPDQTVVLTQGSNVTITGTYPNFTIASTDTNTTYSAGTALDLSGTTFNVDLSELSTSTSDGDGDYFVVVDTSNAQRKLTKGNINISGFNNDAGYTTNVGDITGVTAGNGLTGGGASGSVTLNVGAGGGITVDADTVAHSDTSSQSSVNNSNGTVIQDVTLDTYGHVTALGSVNLDGRYYTESEIDTKLTDGTVTKINNNWSNAAGNLTGYVNDGGGNLGFRFNATPGATNTLVENGIAYRFDVSNDSTTGDLSLFRGSTASGTAGQTISWTEAFAIDGGTNVLRGFGQTIWTAGNDGSGSGLDADTLDGVQGANYLRSDTSDTFNGTLTVTTGIALDNGSSDGASVEFKSAGNTSWEIDNSGGALRFFQPGTTYVTVTTSSTTLNGIGIAESFQEDYDALSGTTPAPDADNAGAFSLTTSGNTTFTFGSVTSGRSVGFILELTAGGTHTITWPASVEWAGGSAPDAPASGETDIYVFWTRDGGTTWYGALAIDAAA